MSKKLYLFSAEGCKPCQKMWGELNKFPAEKLESLVVYDDRKNLKEFISNAITHLPTLIVKEGGKEERFVGPSMILTVLKRHLGV